MCGETDSSCMAVNKMRCGSGVMSSNCHGARGLSSGMAVYVIVVSTPSNTGLTCKHCLISPKEFIQTALSCFGENLPFGDRRSSVLLSAITRRSSFCCQLLEEGLFLA